MDFKELVIRSQKQSTPLSVVVSRERIKELLEQIETLKPLLLSSDPEIQLKASTEIRSIHDCISVVDQLANRPERFKRKKRPRKKKQPTLGNGVFRPGF